MSEEPHQLTPEVTKGWPHGPSTLELRLGNNLTRIIVALIGIPVVLGLLYLGGWWLNALVIAISTGALLEFYWMVEKQGIKPLKVIGVVAGIAFICATAIFCDEYGNRFF